MRTILYTEPAQLRSLTINITENHKKLYQVSLSYLISQIVFIATRNPKAEFSPIKPKFNVVTENNPAYHETITQLPAWFANEPAVVYRRGDHDKNNH